MEREKINIVIDAISHDDLSAEEQRQKDADAAAARAKRLEMQKAMAKKLSKKCKYEKIGICEKFNCCCMMTEGMYSCSYWVLRPRITDVVPGVERKIVIPMKKNPTMQEYIDTLFHIVWKDALLATVEFWAPGEIKARQENAKIRAKETIEPHLRKFPLADYALAAYKMVRRGDPNYIENPYTMTKDMLRKRAQTLGFTGEQVNEFYNRYHND
jgi:hypothetical protein